MQVSALLIRHMTSAKCLYSEVGNVREKAETKKRFKGLEYFMEICTRKYQLLEALTFVIDFAFTRDLPISPIGFLERTTKNSQNIIP